MNWNDMWVEAHERSPLRLTAENEGKWTEYWSHCAEQYLQEIASEREFHRSIVDHLSQEGWLRGQDEVLDVGCGPGTYSIPIAMVARRVIGLDSSEGMLNSMMISAQREGLKNVNTRLANWDVTNEERQYDLVISAMSPAVRDRGGLLRMEAASKRSCCYITGASCDDMRHRNELWEKIVGPYNPSTAYDIIYPLNLLMGEGRYPEMKYMFHDMDVVLDPQMVVENYKRYFRIFTEMSPRKDRVIEDYIMERTTDGVFHKHGRRGLVVLCWNIPGV